MRIGLKLWIVVLQEAKLFFYIGVIWMYTLITGSTGFIGKRLLNALLLEKREIRCLVRKSSNISEIKKHNVDIVFGDVGNLDSVKKAMENVDAVYHLAAFANPSNYKPYSHYKINVDGTKNVLEAALKNKDNIKRMIFMSSIAATGPSLNGEFLDESSGYYPITNYGKSKVEVEKLVHEYEKKYSIPCTIIRPPMVYGIGDKDWVSFFNMVKNASEKGKKLFVPGDHKNYFDFCYVDNLVKGMIQSEKSDKAIGETYFISDSFPYRIEDILKAITDAYGVDYPKKFYSKEFMNILAHIFDFLGKIFHFDGPLSKRDVAWMTSNYWVVSCEKAKRDFGYSPEISLNEGIKRTIEWNQGVK